MASVIYLHVYMQEENIPGRNNAKCHVFALVVNLLTIVYPKDRTHNIIERTNKILLNTLTPSVTSLI